jgi:hypothetical protein
MKSMIYILGEGDVSADSGGFIQIALADTIYV